MSGAQVSQVKKSECGITQPGSCITGNNVLNKGGARAISRSEYFYQWETLNKQPENTNTASQTNLLTCRSSANSLLALDKIWSIYTYLY